MIYEPSFKYRVCECSGCGYEFEPLGDSAYASLCDECWHDQVEVEAETDIY